MVNILYNPKTSVLLKLCILNSQFSTECKLLGKLHTCTVGIIVEASAQTVPTKGIWVAAATSRSAFAATMVYSRMLLLVVVGWVMGILGAKMPSRHSGIYTMIPRRNKKYQANT
jgi:hypothetical protein